MSFFRTPLLACLALFSAAVSAARGSVSITDAHVTNLGTTTFTVVWTTSEVSTPGLDVFTDAAGTTAVTSALGLEFFPIAEGDPAIVNSALAREARRSLEVLAMNRRVVSVRVTGLSPGTNYHVRPRTFNAAGSDNGAGVVPLLPATTAQFSSLVADVRLLQIRVPTFASEGMILLVQGPAGTTPLSAIVGDSAAADVALFSTAGLIDTSTGTNAAFNTPQVFVIRAIGAGAPTTPFTTTVNFTGGFGAATTEVIQAEIESPAPMFTAHPEDLTVVVGSTATFTAAATGTPAPSYQWQRKAAGSSTWSTLAASPTYTGVTSATLSVVNPTLLMNGDAFRALASNGVPPDATSDAATLGVTAAAVAPAITTQPESVSVLAGVNATFAVVATGAPTPNYQWQRKLASDSTWTDLANGAVFAGATTHTLTVLAPTLAATGDQFRVIVSNGVPPQVTSTAVTLTVSAASVAPVITTQPQSTSVGLGATATFTVAASGTPTPSYTWQIKLASGSTWIDLGDTTTYSGTETSSLTVANVTLSMSGDQFRAIAANGTLPNATTNAATLTVLVPPTITAQPLAVTVNAGLPATFSVTANGTGTLTYLWQRFPAGGTAWQAIADDSTYAGVTTATLNVKAALPLLSGDLFRCVVTDTVGSTTSDAAKLTVTKGVAVIALGKLNQLYNGTARPVTATTVPAGLKVNLTYNGSSTEPIAPGVYAVSAEIDDPAYRGSATGALTITTTVLVRSAPTIAGTVDGSVQVITPEATTIKGLISGDLLVRGTPQVLTQGTPTFGGTRDGVGATEPTNYAVTLEATAVLRYLMRRVDAVALPTIATPPAPTGTRNVTLSTAAQSAGDFATIRNLNVSGTVGLLEVPPGTYGTLTANGSAGFVLGVAGATEPAVYNLQGLSINPLLATARLTLAGPVILNVSGAVTLFGLTGSEEHPAWLTLNVSAGAVSTNTGATVHGRIVAPNSLVTLNGRSVVNGVIVADRLNVTANAEVNQVEP